MTMSPGEMLAEQMDETRAWTLRLLADLAPADWAYAPAPGLAHPLWLCGHLAVSQHVLVHVRCLGRGILDPQFVARFPVGGPVPPVAGGNYPTPVEVRAVLDDAHARTLPMVRQMSEALLAEPAFGQDGAVHPHYRDKRGAVTHCFRHEAFHAGQLALLRRLVGKSFLR